MKKTLLSPTFLTISLLAMSNHVWANNEVTHRIISHATDFASPNLDTTNQQTQPEHLHINSKEEGEELFYQCASIINDGARLACFDSLAQGEVPSTLSEKRPLHLSKTVVSTFKGDPQIVLADQEINTQNKQTADINSTPEQYTPLSLAYDLDKNSDAGLWRARPHNPMYILPVFVNAKPNHSPSTPNQPAHHYTGDDMRNTELKFQASFKSKVAQDVFGTNADLWLGYTQQSHWQVYNENHSRPFRAHDYQPEMFLTQPVKGDLPFGGKLRMIGAGAVHHSNGEDDPLSRSWNRIYAMAGMEWGNLTVMPRVWTRFAKASDTSKPDDNPDIMDYYGYGDVKFLYQLQQGKNISGTVRYNPKTQKGALQLDYVHPIGRGVSGYVQLFQGYGQSIVDYNHESTTIGVGIMLNDWMGL
ncbi:phospholipase A [Moraxella oblonga]|uniref:phospholipase A n=1 Tax=Moraxella oblonga TaxID=200413 RepID=UPI0009FE93C0|nr:phospholipase A [Moraxella oblonga]